MTDFLFLGELFLQDVHGDITTVFLQAEEAFHCYTELIYFKRVPDKIPTHSFYQRIRKKIYYGFHTNIRKHNIKNLTNPGLTPRGAFADHAPPNELLCPPHTPLSSQLNRVKVKAQSKHTFKSVYKCVQPDWLLSTTNAKLNQRYIYIHIYISGYLGICLE